MCVGEIICECVCVCVSVCVCGVSGGASMMSCHRPPLFCVRRCLLSHCLQRPGRSITPPPCLSTSLLFLVCALPLSAPLINSLALQQGTSAAQPASRWQQKPQICPKLMASSVAQKHNRNLFEAQFLPELHGNFERALDPGAGLENRSWSSYL